MTLWQSFREVLRDATSAAYWCVRIDRWIMRTHVPPYDWVLPRDVEPWVPCRRCWQDWPCEHFLRAEEHEARLS